MQTLVTLSLRLLLPATLVTPAPAERLPDLLITKIDVRDRQRLGLTTPTVGNGIRVYAEVRNASGTGAPDVAFVCRRLSGPRGAQLAQASVRTGSLPANATKRLTLDIDGPTAAGTGAIWCMVDGGNFVPESNAGRRRVRSPRTGAG